MTTPTQHAQEAHTTTTSALSLHDYTPSQPLPIVKRGKVQYTFQTFNFGFGPLLLGGITGTDYVCGAPNGGHPMPSIAQAKGHFDEILRRYNSHAALVEALERAEQHLRFLAQAMPEGAATEVCKEVAGQARSALAAARKT